MGLQDFPNRFMGNLARGDLSGALGDIGDIAEDTLGLPQKGQVGPPQMGMFSPIQMGDSNISQVMDSLGKQKQAGRTPGKQDAAKETCCNRFSLSNGFLVDGVSGRVWQFDTATSTFDEVSVKNTAAKQDLIDSMLESKLSLIRAQYEREALATVPRPRRAALLAQFEKDHLDPLRAAAQGVTY